MILSTKQIIAICSLSAALTTSSIIGCIALERRRKEYLKQIEEMKKPSNKNYAIEKRNTFITNRTEEHQDAFGSTSQDPEDPVITETIIDRVDVLLPNSIAQLGSRFAQTKTHRYAIYADMSIVRPGDYDTILLNYYSGNNQFIFNGYPAAPIDIEKMFGRDFAEEIITLGIGRDMQLLIYSNVLISDYDNFFRIVLTFHKGESPEMDIINNDELYDPDADDIYDPDDTAYSEPDEEDLLDDEDEEDEEAARIDELMENEELANSERMFDPGAAIYIHPTGELTELEVYEGWSESPWTYRTDTGLLYDEEDEVVSQEDALVWIGLECLSVICSPHSLIDYPMRTIYVRNEKLKIMYEISLH